MMEEQFNIVQLFFASARKYPDKTAIIERNKSISFSQLEKQVQETTAYFLSKGIEKGDRVLLFVPMSIDLYRIVLALFNMGAVAVFLDEWVNKKRMEECCRIAQCKVFIGVFKATLLVICSMELRKISIKLGTGYSKSSSNKKMIVTNKNDTALITFTTGSTGTPKAAKRTHGFLHEQFNALKEEIDPQPDDVDMPVLPIVLLINLGVGCTSVIAPFKPSKPESMNVKKITNQLVKHNITRLIASPFFVKRLARYFLAKKIRVSALKKLFTGGAPVFPNEADIYCRAFPDSYVQIIYGSTEAEPISSINAKELIKDKAFILKKGLNVGEPYRKAEVKVIKIKDEPIQCKNNEDLRKLELPFNKIGELIVSGPHVLQAYLNNEEALERNKIFVADTCWHRTGDSGYRDETGKLYLTGRCNTLIIKNNKILAPFIYENYFQSIEGVELGTILNLNDKIVAVVEVIKAADKKMIRAKIHHLDKQFDGVVLLDTIPRDPRHNSKIDYGLLYTQMKKFNF